MAMFLDILQNHFPNEKLKKKKLKIESMLS